MPIDGGTVRRLQRVGLSAFHPCTIAVGLQVHDRLCDSLIPSIRNLFPTPFGVGTPAVDLRFYSGYPENRRGVPVSAYALSPCILLSGLSSHRSLRCRQARIRVSRCELYFTIKRQSNPDNRHGNKCGMKPKNSNDSCLLFKNNLL